MKIAIKGHPTRGNEAIKILESLGGKNKHELFGDSRVYYYFIDKDKTITWCLKPNTPNVDKYYTLEEFKEEFPFKIGDKVIFKDDDSSNPTIYTITGFESYIDGLRYSLDNSRLHFSSIRLKLYTSMKEERNITLTLDKAKEWYQNGGELREIALQVFTKEELNPLPKSWEEFCKTHVITPEKYIFESFCPKKYIALWKLEQLRDCYRQGWKPDFSKSTSYNCIFSTGKYLAVSITTLPCFLVFPEKTIAQEFLKNFESLIKEAGDLI